jgi:hypothetical protein
VLLSWTYFLAYLLFLNRNIGFRLLNHTLPHLAWIIHLIAICVWFGITEVKLKGKSKCENDGIEIDEKADICATTGPNLALA